MGQQVVRIKGLVRIAQHVRAEIGRGMDAVARDRLRQTVDRALAQVRGILASHGAGPGRLAAPSRKAFEYLAQIAWDGIAVNGGADSSAAAAGAARGHVGQMSWSGLKTLLDRVVRRLALPPGEGELAQIAQTISRMSGRLEGTLRRDAISAEQLTPQTRELRGWFAWMSEGENFGQYVAAVRRVVAQLERVRGSAPGAAPDRLLVEFRPDRHIYRLRRTMEGTRIVLPTPMIALADEPLADLAQLIFGRHRGSKAKMVQHMAGEAYADLAEEIEALGGVVEVTRGAVHDLAESFERVNARYFGGQMARPRLSWSRGFTRRKFGHYDHVRDWVMLSSTMDQGHVPPFVVDFVMYHELLHKKHGIRWVNGRGHAHTSAFHEEEKRFERYEEAEQWITNLARG